MKINNVRFLTFTSKGDGIELKFSIEDKDAKDILSSLIDLKKKVGTLTFEIDGQATADEANKITPAQLGKIHVLYQEISDYTGHTVDEVRELMLANFQPGTINLKFESTRELDKATASNLIEFILGYMYENDIVKKSVINIDKAYLNMSLTRKHCLVCAETDVKGRTINGVQFYLCERHDGYVKDTGVEKFIKYFHLQEIFK